MPERAVIAAFEAEFAALRRNAERAIAQLDDAGLRRAIDADTNSVAVIMQHLAGNFRSRFTEFLTTDGEKPWRDRDAEFIDRFAPGAEGRAQIEAAWREGWRVLEESLAGLDDAQLAHVVRIRGEPHDVARALARSLAHAGYHVGQIVQTSRTIVGPERWTTISIPRGASEEANRRMGYRPEPPRR